MSLKADIGRRYKSILQVNELARSASTAPAVFEGMCTVLQKLVPYDRAELMLYDSDHDSLRIVDGRGRKTSEAFAVGQFLSRTGSQSGWAFEHKCTLLRRNLARERRFPSDIAAIDEGYVSVCSAPLVIQGSGIGVVTIGTEKNNRLTSGHAEIVQELSDQIALGIAVSMRRCPIHMGTNLVCPRCIGSSGGKTTVLKHREDLRIWGKQGGRGRRNIKIT